ncbi:thioredoxin [Reichenbachiella versicolor]|uniref:thioredoxin n=1 Tax=Reichenbachiella versicolor TaxID=1821036 RepID=UPI0013A5915A|nr:thioredoxin [Reichenbachiella versicolor]
MKKLKALLSLSFILISLVSQAQSNELYIVINEASWCKYCKANGERIHELIDKYALDHKVKVINNDMTNNETKQKSIPTLKKYGLYNYMQYQKVTAMVFVFDAKNSEIADKFPIKLENEKILKHLNETLELVQG